jgi:ribosomal protein S18 acetylase RimI-like enzyme
VGEALLREVLGEAAGCGLPVRIHVERGNPARRLYARLGFVPLAERGIYHELEWSPAPSAQAKTAS